MGFPKQEYWSGSPFLSPGDLPEAGINLSLLHCRRFLYHWTTWEARLFKKKKKSTRAQKTVIPTSEDIRYGSLTNLCPYFHPRTSSNKLKGIAEGPSSELHKDEISIPSDGVISVQMIHMTWINEKIIKRRKSLIRTVGTGQWSLEEKIE